MAKDKSADIMKNFLSGVLFDLITELPETVGKPAQDPDKTVDILIRNACLKAAAVSTTLSVPAGITGIVASIPDIVAVWRIQAQLVSDIAVAYGQLAILTKESMLLCLFRHSFAHLLQDFITRTGPRIIVHKLSTSALKKILEKVGLHFSSKFLRRVVMKAIPAIGAVSNGAISFWDTKQVGKTAKAYFQSQTTPRP